MTQDSEPEFEDVLNEILESHAAQLHVALPGKVVRYDAAKQLADVQLLIKDSYLDGDDVVTRAYPLLPRVPVMFPRGGGFFVIVPITAGDTGLLVFNDLPIDKWRASGQESHPGDLRRHSLTSAVFIPGLVYSAQALPEGSANADLVLGRTSGLTARITAGGIFQIGSGAFGVPADENLQIELTRITTELTTLKEAIAAGFTAGGEAAAYAGATAQLSAFNAGASAVPGSPAATALAKVKAE